MGEQYKCKVCSKNIGKTEGHYRSGNGRGWVHADCKGKVKPSKPAKPAKNGKNGKKTKNGKSKTVKPPVARPPVDLDPDTTAEVEEENSEAAAEAAALANAIAEGASELDPKVAE